jgi:histidinol phosphatase-like enzyme
VRYLFHSCNECLAQNKKKTVKEKTLCNKEEYYLVKIDGFSDYSETWIRPKNTDIYTFSLFHRMNLEVERVVAWHRYTPSLFRPINHVKKSYKEIYEMVKNRNLRELDFTSGEAFYYLIKWKGLDYSCCTWEHEFLLKNQYSKVFEFVSKKNREELQLNKGEQLPLEQPQMSGGNLKGVGSLVARLLPGRHLSAVRRIVKEEKSQLEMLTGAVDSMCSVIIGFLDESRQSQKRSVPVLLLCHERLVVHWKDMFDLLTPHLQYVHYTASDSSEDLVDRFELNSLRIGDPALDVLLVDYSTFLHHKNNLITIEWSNIIIDPRFFSAQTFEAIDLLNKPYYSSGNLGITWNIESVWENRDELRDLIMFKVGQLRLLKDKNIYSLLGEQSWFQNCTQIMMEFYLTKQNYFKKKLESLKQEELEALIAKIDSLIPQISFEIEACESKELHLEIVERNIILRYSDKQKESYDQILNDDLDLLTSLDKKSEKESYTLWKRCHYLFAKITAIHDDMTEVNWEEENRLAEWDTRLRWLERYFELLKQQNRHDKVLVLFTNEQTQNRYVKPFQKLTKYSLEQIYEHYDSQEISPVVSKFNKIDKKLGVMFLQFGSLHKVRLIDCQQVVIVGATGWTAQAEMKVKSVQVENTCSHRFGSDHSSKGLQARLRRSRRDVCQEEQRIRRFENR